MASIEFLETRVAGKEKELEKLNKKLERIRKVEAQNWQDPNPYYYSEYDLRSVLKDIDSAQIALNSYKEKLAAEIEKNSSRNVPAIVEFLDDWRERVIECYTEALDEFFAEKQAVKELYSKINFKYYCFPTEPDQIAYEEAKKAFYSKCHGYFEDKEVTNRFGKLEKTKVKIRDGEFEWLHPYSCEIDTAKALERLKKDLDQEWNRKYDFIIERTNQIVGQITDASNLSVGAKHDLNGYIIGTKGKASVQTISAGGYNIQRFHFRTLINKM